MPRLSMTPQVFAILSGLVEERIGLHYGPEDQDLLADKASVCAQEEGFDSLLDYYYYLRYDDPDRSSFDVLAEALVVGETYFFRELPALRGVVESWVLPRIREQGRVRLWSAAASTGEEPLTLAMLLASAGRLDRAELVASDLSRAALARAQGGQWGLRSVRHVTDDALVARWLHPTQAGWAVDPALVAAVDWRRVNLLDADEVSSQGLFDMILCRNVLIYFSEETARRVVSSLVGQLRPGGILMVGVSESLMRLAPELECHEHGGAFVYRKATE